MTRTYILLIFLLSICTHSLVHAQVGLNILQPDSSAELDISSTSRGLLPPRLSQAQRDSIRLPATGLVIFNSTSKTIQFNSGTKTVPVWRHLSSDTGAAPTNVAFRVDASGNTAVQLTSTAFQYLTLDSIEWNDGGNYNPLTGIFTAPVSGMYMFDAEAIFYCTADFGAGVYITVNNSAFTSAFYWYPGSTYGVAVSAATSIKLRAGDQVRMKIYSVSTTIPVFYSPGRFPNVALSHFGGTLLHRF